MAEYLDKEGLNYTIQKINTSIDNKLKEKEKIDFYGCYDFLSYLYYNARQSPRAQVGFSAIIPLKRIDLSNIPDIYIELSANAAFITDAQYTYDTTVNSAKSFSGNNHLTFSKHDTSITFSAYPNKITTYKTYENYTKGSINNDNARCAYIIREDKNIKGVFDIFLQCIVTTPDCSYVTMKDKNCTIKHLYWNVTQTSITPDRDYSFSDLSSDIVVRSATDMYSSSNASTSNFYNKFVEHFSTYNTVFAVIA